MSREARVFYEKFLGRFARPFFFAGRLFKVLPIYCAKVPKIVLYTGKNL